MNISYFISKRILKTQGNSFSSVIHKIAVGSIAIGLAVMMVSFFILGGFQKVIREKAYSFSGHYQASKYTYNSNLGEASTISLNDAFFQNSSEYDFVSHVQEYAYKPGLLKTTDEVAGVVLKGIGPSFDFERFSENMIAGKFVVLNDSTNSKDVVLSQKIANKLELKVGEKVLMYFVQNPPRYRQLNIVGIYETGLEDFDDKIIIGDIKLIRRLNNWPDSLAGGYEIFVNDLGREDELQEELLELVPYDMKVEKVSDKYIQIFDWLLLLDRNVVIFLFLILFVACFNMVSIVFILIMERTQMIGILKAIGSTSGQIRRIFLYNGVQLIVKGLILGNIVGLGFAAIQYFFRLIPLDPKNYYMSYAPIDWNWMMVLLLNLLTLFLVGTVVFIVTVVIDRVRPIKAIRFD